MWNIFVSNILDNTEMTIVILLKNSYSIKFPMDRPHQYDGKAVCCICEIAYQVTIHFVKNQENTIDHIVFLLFDEHPLNLN